MKLLPNQLIRTIYIIIFIIFASLCGSIFFICNNHSIDVSKLEWHANGKPSILLDDTGNEWTRFQIDRRDPVSFDQIPTHVINAFIAAEDWNFFNHIGISYKGILRSFFINVYNQRIVQGASTITQQLAKLIFFDSQKTFSRKIKELLYSLLIERQFSKEQILEKYLNVTYFGCGIYGVQAASIRFWNKDVWELSIDEAALLAGVVKSPNRYCPLISPHQSQQRRNTVLQSMHKLGYISYDEYNIAISTPITIASCSELSYAPHLKELLRTTLEQKLGKNALYTGGYVIQTTINKRMQLAAQKIFEQKCDDLQSQLNIAIDGGLLAIEGATGAIKIMIGGKNFAQSQFNRATQARRQMGSIIKPLIYAAALKHNLLLQDVEIDEPIEITVDTSVWKPRNNNLRFNGPMTRAYALYHSNNIVAIKTLLKINPYTIISLAQKCHITGPFHPYPSLALGCIDSTVQEVVGMFNSFAHNGTYVEPYSIEWIKDQWGKKIWKHAIIKESVIESKVASQVAKILERSILRFKQFFTKEWYDGPAICKTGTTNDSRTCWFVGSTPTLTTGIYIGCDDNQPMGKNIYPVHTAFPIWLNVVNSAKTPLKHFNYDTSLKEVIIHELTGEPLASAHDPHAISILV